MRWSDPNEGLANDRFRVWDENADLYAHQELAANWDTLDAILGRPTSGAAWPALSERGSGKGLYKLIELLNAERPQPGDFKWGWVPADGDTAAQVLLWQQQGWEVAEGQVISAGNHHFPGLGSSSVRLPDIRNRGIVGADQLAEPGDVGAIGNAAGDAPGVVYSDGVQNIGERGTNTQTISMTVPAHSHQVPNHSHTVDSHTHGMNHHHETTDLQGGNLFGSGAAYKLNASAIQTFLTFEAATNNYSSIAFTNAAPPYETISGGAIVPSYGHTHYAGFNIGTPRSVANINAEQLYTSASSPGTSQAGASTLTQGAVAIQATGVDNRPLQVGLIPLIKVRNVTSLT